MNYFLLTCLAILFICSPALQASDSVEVDDFSKIKLYTLTNDTGMTVKLTNYGGTLTSILVPDKNGNPQEVIWGYDSADDYINATYRLFQGATIGRYSNQIANGQFTIDGTKYQVARSNYPHNLHGGEVGFDRVVWNAVPVVGEDFTGIKLTYLSEDGNEGFPGNLNATVIYKLAKKTNALTVTYEATTDKATPVSMTNHAYFNFKGEGETNRGHEVMINSDEVVIYDNEAIPTGELGKVAGTAFDFNTPKTIGEYLDTIDVTSKIGMAHDKYFVLKKNDKPACQVYEPETGIVMTVTTDAPGMAFYSGGFIPTDLMTGKSGKHYFKNGAFSIETHRYPDAPNHDNFPNAILRPGEKYESESTFAFSTK